MKAKTMLGLIACASACVSLSAFGNTNDDWFAVSVLDSTATLTHVSTNMGVEVAGSKLLINTDSESLVFTPDPLFAGTNRSDGVVTIAASVALTPSSLSDFEATIPNAKVGIAVGINDDVTNYYGYASAGWKVLTGENVSVPAPGGDTSFALVLDYRTHVAQFYVDETLMTYGDTTPTNAPAFAPGTDTLLNIAASGSGSITSIDTDFEVAVVDVGGTKYGSVADAEAAGGDASTIKKIDDTGAVINKTTADNGLSVAVCTALGLDIDESTANIAVAPVGTDVDATKITLAVNVDAAPEASVVKFGVTPVGGGETIYYDDASAIKIPLAAGTYTITPVLK